MPQDGSAYQDTQANDLILQGNTSPVAIKCCLTRRLREIWKMHSLTFDDEEITSPLKRRWFERRMRSCHIFAGAAVQEGGGGVFGRMRWRVVRFSLVMSRSQSVSTWFMLMDLL